MRKIKFQNSWNIHERPWIITNRINMEQDCKFCIGYDRLRGKITVLSLARFILWKRKEENRNVSRRVSSRNDSALRFQRACLVSDKRARGSRTKVCPDKISLIAPVWPRTVHVHVRFSFAFPDLVATFPIFLLSLCAIYYDHQTSTRFSLSLLSSSYCINKNLGVVETTSNINN